MPNWCSNKLIVSGEPAEVGRFVNEARGPLPQWGDSDDKDKTKSEIEELSFHAIMPVPKKVLKQGYNKVGYHWCVERWGTKWGACNISVDKGTNQCIYHFDTAWGPMSEEFYDHMSAKYPTLEFDYKYALAESGEGIGYMNGDDKWSLMSGYCEEDPQDVKFNDMFLRTKGKRVLLSVVYTNMTEHVVMPPNLTAPEILREIFKGVEQHNWPIRPSDIYRKDPADNSTWKVKSCEFNAQYDDHYSTRFLPQYEEWQGFFGYP